MDLARAYEIASSSRVVQLGLRTSMIVGSVLNLINQGDALLGDATLNVFKLGLTYVVPYCVATFSATSVLLKSSEQLSVKRSHVTDVRAQREQGAPVPTPHHGK